MHLAGIQSVPESWDHPAEVFRVNTGGTAALLRAIEVAAPEAHLVLASTAAVYGDSPGTGGSGADSRDEPRPFTEDDPVRPGSPYGASKAAAEILTHELAARTGLPVTIARLFNQFGPEQPVAQVPACFAAEIARAEARSEKSVTLKVGNPAVERDYTDTRDTARALRLAVERGTTGTFNFCTGTTHSLARVIEGLAATSKIEVKVEVRSECANRNDVAVFAGAPERLKVATGWSPQVPLDQTVAGMLQYRRGALRRD